MSSSVNFISTIKELNNPNVHIKDKDRVNGILKSIIEGGTKRLQVVSDFDRTITKQHEDGKTHISSFGTMHISIVKLLLRNLFTQL